MDGRNNLANQEVFRMAKSADPTGSRTVGVVTKCDALQPGEELGVSIRKTSVANIYIANLVTVIGYQDR